MVSDRRPPNLAPPVSVSTAILLASVQRAVTHIETLAAASTTESSRRKLTIAPMTDKTKDEYAIVTGIATQGINPRQLSITAKDLNRQDFRLLLSPDLEVPELILVGAAPEGIQLTFESFSGAEVAVVIRVATINRARFEAIFGGLRRVEARALATQRGVV